MQGYADGTNSLFGAYGGGRQLTDCWGPHRFVQALTFDRPTIGGFGVLSNGLKAIALGQSGVGVNTS